MLATPMAPTLISAGYLNCSVCEKTEVVANESISNRFCKAASVEENCERRLGGTSCEYMIRVQWRPTTVGNPLLGRDTVCSGRNPTTLFDLV